MKNVLRITLALVALVVCSASTSSGDQAVWVHKVVDNLKFRTHAAAIVGNEGGGVYGVDELGGYVDSLAASGIAKLDTTTALSTAGWTAYTPGGAVADSALVCKLLIYDSGLSTVTLGKTSATAESIYVKTQVSANKVDWHDCALIPGHSPVIGALTAQTTVNAQVITFTSSTNTGISGKMWTLRYNAGIGAAGGKVGPPDIYHIIEYPWVRWVIYGTRATTNHSYKADVVRWSAGNETAK